MCYGVTTEKETSEEAPREVREEEKKKKSDKSDDDCDSERDGSEVVCGEGFVDVLCKCLRGDPVAEKWNGDDVG